MKRLVVVAGIAVLGCSLSACGGSDSSDNTSSAPSTAAEESDSSNDTSESGSSDGTSTLIVDGEAVEVAFAGGCHVNQQNEMLAAAKIAGKNAAGEQVMLDFTRYRDDHPTPGDSIQFTIESPGSVAWLMGTFDEGTVTMSDDIVAANDLEVSDSSGSTAVVSFKISC